MDKIEKRKKKLQNTIKESKKIGANALELIANDIENEIEDLALKNKTSAENRRNAYDKKKSVDEFKRFIDSELGSFYFNLYKELLLLKLETQLIFRFMVLCTYTDYDFKLRFGNAIKTTKKNEFCDDRKNTKESYMIEKDLPEVLKLGERECRNTKKSLIESNLIKINNDKTITVNKKYCLRGKITKKMKENGGFVRMFDNAIRELNEKAKATEHKRLGLLIKLLPFINIHHNIVTYANCIDEEDITKVKAMKMKDVCEIVGYKNSTQLKRDLFNITVNDETVIGIFETKYGKMIYVNPRVYYKGSSIDNLKALINMFRVRK